MKQNSFSHDLLEFIKNVGYLLPGFESKYEYARRLRRSTYYGTLRRLEEKKYISRKIIDNKLAYRITPQGEQLISEKVPVKKRKDGFSTIVVFDIPEAKRKARNGLRRYLKNNGFRALQKSIYISNNKVPKTLLELVHELDIHSHVSVIGGDIEYYL